MKDKLYRSRVKRVFGGVAGGLAEYMNLDPILVRILFIIVAAINGIGVLLYIIMWIVIPEAPLEYEFPNYEKGDAEPGKEGQTSDKSSQDFSSESFGTTRLAQSSNSRLIVGIILIGIGMFFLLDNLFPFIDFVDIFPLALVVVGIALLWNSIQKRNN